MKVQFHSTLMFAGRGKGLVSIVKDPSQPIPWADWKMFLLRSAASILRQKGQSGLMPLFFFFPSLPNTVRLEKNCQHPSLIHSVHKIPCHDLLPFSVPKQFCSIRDRFWNEESESKWFWKPWEKKNHLPTPHKPPSHIYKYMVFLKWLWFQLNGVLHRVSLSWKLLCPALAS